MFAIRSLALFVGVALISMLACPPRTSAQFMRKSTKQLVEEYVADKVLARPESILEDLSKRGRGEMFDAIKKAIGVEDTRAKAIKLAALMSVPKMWDWVKRYYETDTLRADVMAVGLAGHDSAAVDFLFERWKSIDMKEKETEFSELQTALSEYALDIDALEKFIKLLKDKDFEAERKTSAAAIVAAQMFSSAVDVESALKSFDEFKKKHGVYARPARLKTANLFTENDIFLQGKTRTCGKCWWIAGQGRVGLCAIPDKWQTGSYQVTVHVKPVGESGSFSVDIFSSNNEWSIEGNIGDGKWTMDNSIDPDLMSPPLLKNAWNKVMLQIMDEGGQSERGDRMMKVEVNGKLVTDWASLRGNIGFLAVTSGGAEVVVGGAETNKR